MKLWRFFLAVIILGSLTGAALAEDGYVQLAIKGTNVNLRPQPRAAGSAIAQANAGDIFIAEKWPIVCTGDQSEWYKIVLVCSAESNKISMLSEWDSRFTSDVAFVSAGFATISPLEEGDMENISATPWGPRSLYTNPQTGKFSPETDAGFRFFSAKRTIRISTEIYDRNFTDTNSDDAKVIGRYKSGDSILLLGANADETVYIADDQNFEQPFGWIAADAVDKVGANHEAIDVYHFASLTELFAGFSIGEMVRKWGNFEVRRGAEEWIGSDYFIFTHLNAQDMEIHFYESEPYSAGQIAISSFHTSRKGAVVGGICIGADWCGTDWVKQAFGEPHSIGISEDDDGEEHESWSWETGFQSLYVRFARDGVVSSVILQQRAAD